MRHTGCLFTKLHSAVLRSCTVIPRLVSYQALEELLSVQESVAALEELLLSVQESVAAGTPALEQNVSFLC